MTLCFWWRFFALVEYRRLRVDKAADVLSGTSVREGYFGCVAGASVQHLETQEPKRGSALLPIQGAQNSDCAHHVKAPKIRSPRRTVPQPRRKHATLPRLAPSCL